jgi:hypothetical protein
MFISLGMNALAEWMEKKNSHARKALFLKIKERFPRFTQTSLSQYIKEKRIPSHEIAQIISEFTGLPLEVIAYRYVNKPRGGEETTQKETL